MFKKAIMITIIITFQVILLFGCSHTTPETDPELGYPNYPPHLTIAVDNKNIAAVRGPYSWEYMGTCTEASTDPPPELVKYQKESLIIKPNSLISLKFEKKPNHIEVYIISGNNSFPQEFTDGVIIAPQQKGIIAYEVSAYWEEGSSHYAFAVEVTESESG